MEIGRGGGRMIAFLALNAQQARQETTGHRRTNCGQHSGLYSPLFPSSYHPSHWRGLFQSLPHHQDLCANFGFWDSGELLVRKQVSIDVNSASKEKTQAHIRELEEEVKLLKNLSHLNIVRYLGTAREEESLNILLEFVPGGSISSFLGKFGSFPESLFLCRFNLGLFVKL